MAGGNGHGPFRMTDPAVERFDQFRETQYKRFRWTPANARFFFVYVIAVPTVIYGIASYGDSRYKWKGALKSDVLDQKTK
ncbi:hypothetical protein BDZ89DRAFT_1057169 [Hymenopellis radicata]|nr:hypothetical protein BDZ89DRAFT_1057169 [Hymenopellis radicata]